MKNLYTLFLLITGLTFAQTTTTLPTIPTEADAITITFDATGSELEGYTGNVYAHTGVVTTASTSNSDWKHVIGTWGNNNTQPQLTRISTNVYEWVISPNIPSYYSTETDETVTNIAVVFRSADGSSQSRPDIFIPIYEAGLNVTLTNPLNNAVFTLNETTTISADASTNANLELTVNNISIQTATNSSTITASYTFSSTGAQSIEAIATLDGETRTNEISVFVKSPTQNEAIPANLSKGLNRNNDGSVTFVLEAPNKTDVFVIGDFNNWSLNDAFQMKKDGDLFWLTLNTLDADTEYAYQYYIDFDVKVADPYSRKILDPDNDQYIPDTTFPNLKAYPAGQRGFVSSFKINEADYTWQTTTFNRPEKENLVVYEMLIRDFTESGTYAEAITRLDYLQNLGVNAIELMPVNEFDGNSSWGYNPALYMAIDKAYGTANDLKAFIDACHQRGIAVLGDMVLNHSYGNSPLVQMYWDSANNRPAADSPYYNQSHNLVDNTSAHWGYDFNHESTYTVNFFKDVLSYWLTEFKLDGFRFDFTKGLSNTIYTGAGNWASAYDADRIAILKAYADHVWAENPSTPAYVIFEHLADNSEETELANYGIMLWGNLNHNINQNTMGFSSGADINWLSYKNRGWNTPNVVGYMESHDEERLMVRNMNYGNANGNYDTKDFSTALDRIEAATVVFYSVPGPKMLWQFGELGYDKSINCENDIDDGSCRLDEKPDAWGLGYNTDAERLDLHNITAKMIALKTTYPSTFNTDDYTLFENGLVKRVNLNDNDGNFDAVVIANFNLTTQTVNPNFSQTGTWYSILDNNTPMDVTNVTETISLAPGEYRIYTTEPVIDPNDTDSDGVPNSEDACPNTTLGATVGVDGCEIFSLPTSNFALQIINKTCRTSNNGSINITASTSLNYNVTISGNGSNTNDSFTTNYSASNLEAGNYEVCITVDGQTDYEQCFNVTITEPEDLSVFAKVNDDKQSVTLNLNGSSEYYITINDVTTKTTSNVIKLALQSGKNAITVKGKTDCQGIYEDTIFYGNQVSAYPNPITNNQLHVYLGDDQSVSELSLYSILGNRVYTVKTQNNQQHIDVSHLKNGIYILNVTTNNSTNSFKIVKQ